MRLAAVLLLVARAALAADKPGELFDKVRAKVIDNSRRVPRYTCVETITRAEYRPQFGTKAAGCQDLIRAREQLVSPGYLTWHDRLRLDVAVLDGKETFSWAGAQQFETTDIRELTASGSTGSGDFAAFLTAVFGLDTTEISFLGGDLFGFRVPAKGSGYHYRSQGNGVERVSGYHGTIELDPDRADLKRLTVDADEFPASEPACRVRDAMEYHRVKIGDGDFLLPETSKMTVLFNSGKESQNETKYSECKEYAGQSTIRFEEAPEPGAVTEMKAAPVKMPAGVRVQIGLQAPIHSETAAAGDAVTGVVLRGPYAKTVVHGRIVRLEQFLFPRPKWVVAFQFENLKPRKDGAFTFEERGNLVLDGKFRSEWETTP
jgi:hypothetical protein